MKTNTLKPQLLAVLLCLGGSLAVSPAAVIYSDNFDSATLGAAPPGWAGVTSGVVVSGAEFVSSPHSVILPAPGTKGMFKTFASVPANFSDILAVSFDVNFTATTTSRVAQVYNSTVENSHAGFAIRSDGTFSNGTGVAGFASYALDTWYSVTLNIRPSVQTYDILVSEVGGGFVGSRLNIAVGHPSLNYGALYVFNDSATGSTYLDNVVIQTIPEPSSYALVGLACGLLALKLRRKKK